MTLQAMIFPEVKRLPPSRLKETLDFVRFLRLRGAIEPEQSYFWSKKWQKLERRAGQDKKKGRVVGDGTVKGLAKVLGR